MKRIIAIGILYTVVGCQQNKPVRQIEEVTLSDEIPLDVPHLLSDWGFFEPPLAELVPVSDVAPYELNTPLFSDYAFKSRFIRLPPGTSAVYDSMEVMQFPVGTVLIKNFYYQLDLTDPQSRRRLMETRLLIHEERDWSALTYIWNDEQNDAVLEVAGRNLPVSWKDERGLLKEINYSVPNLIQCKSCHEKSGLLTPIGLSARQLNRECVYPGGVANQLVHWQETGILQGLPLSRDWPRLPQWDEPASGSLDQRARAWLEINCAHCHRMEGPAKNTGLYLTFNESDPYRIGILKPPVAAGRGSGGLRYDIIPGDPEASILIYRIRSVDPGVMMPELGRQLPHTEGIELVSEWIRQLPAH